MKIESVRVTDDSIRITTESHTLLLPLCDEFLRFRKGEDIDADRLTELVLLSESHQAYVKALFYLRNAKTAEEVKRYLLRKGFSDNAAAAAVKKLLQKRYLDDFQYALSFIAMRKKGKRTGNRLIMAQLYRKGISSETVRRAFADFDGAAESVDDALSAAEKKIKSGYDRNRVARFLISRGFSGDIVSGALRVLDKRYKTKEENNEGQ